MEEKNKAAMYLEDLHISGDTMIEMDHALEDVNPMMGSIYLHDILESYTQAQLEALSWAQWISVEERLPEQSGTYLTAEGDAVGELAYQKGSSEEWVHETDEWTYHRHPSHWMERPPLPLAPEQP